MKLRLGVRVHRRHFRRRRAYVLHDPAANQFFRTDPVSFHLVGLLDGHRTVEEAWSLTCERFGDEAPTQSEVFGLLGQLYQANLVAAEGVSDAAQLFERMKRRQSVLRRQKFASFLFIKIPLLDPAVLIDWLLPLVRPILNKWGLTAWLVLLVLAASQVTPKVGELWAETLLVLRPNNLIWLIGIFWLIKAVHEFGHGVLCRNFGGQVHEMGIMLLVFAPVPYCDATSSWAFDHRLRRALVGLGGVLVELAFACVAAIVWANTGPGPTHELAHNVVFIAGLGTLLFNANPLLRFDGYYVLCDLLDIPNLFKRANAQIRYLVQRWVLGVKQIRPVTNSYREQAWLLSYAGAAWTYRVFVMIAIMWFLSRALFGLGVILVFVVLLTWVVIPLAKFVRFLAASPVLGGARFQAVGMTMGILIMVGAGIGFIPVGQHVYADAVIRPTDWMQLVSPANGFVERIQVKDGQAVRKDDVLIGLSNPTLAVERMKIQAQIEQSRVERRSLLGQELAKVKQVEAKLESLRQELTLVDQQIAGLSVRSPIDGFVVAPWLDQTLGGFIKKGQVLGEVRADGRRHALAVIDQTDNALMFRGRVKPKVELCSVGRLDRIIDATVKDVSPAAHRQMEHRLFGVLGGGPIRTDDTGVNAADPVFEVRLEWPQQQDDAMHFGQRAKVRFTFARQPLAYQWWRRLRQSIEE